MKLFGTDKRATPSKAARHLRGMTLVEIMIATTLMTVVVVGAVMGANLLGLREDQLVESKAGASDTSRKTVSALLSDIRSAKGYYIGTFSGNTFSNCAVNTPQQGPAVILYPVLNSTNQAVDTSQYIVYYFDLTYTNVNNGQLLRYNNVGGPGTASVVASNLINTLYFTSEDYMGNTQSVRTYKGVIHATLQFCQFLYPLTAVGSNCLYDAYRIDCRATPHLPDGP
jgi:Tfp pilus assembly protein PilW